MARSDRGIVKDGMGQEQPKDKERAEAAHETDLRKLGFARGNPRSRLERQAEMMRLLEPHK